MDDGRAWVPVRPLQGLGGAVLVLSALWTALVWAQLGFGATNRDGLRTALGLTVLATWAVTSAWLGRAHDAASALAPGSQRHGRGWAAFGWIVPLVQLWFPKGVVDDAWGVLAALPGRRPKPRTGLWWLAWLVAGFVTSPSVYGNDSASRPVTLGFCVALTVAWLLWARVVVGLTAAYDGPTGSVRRADEEER